MLLGFRAPTQKITLDVHCYKFSTVNVHHFYSAALFVSILMENTQNSNFVRLFVHFWAYRFVINLLQMKIFHIWNNRNSIHRRCVSSKDEFYIEFTRANTHTHTHTHKQTALRFYANKICRNWLTTLIIYCNR